MDRRYERFMANEDNFYLPAQAAYKTGWDDHKEEVLKMLDNSVKNFIHKDTTILQLIDYVKEYL